MRHVTVIGAGAVGASTALALRRDGYAVTLLERGDPGMGTSFGNAGMLSVTSCTPVAM
ncbi:MAG: FAD-dependent oxidoreductase, partial [Alphaproteobacteria bacterium]|nr:FAD-dependent oxidoreductase [Alphaproteobacteria bacterium]